MSTIIEQNNITTLNCNDCTNLTKIPDIFSDGDEPKYINTEPKYNEMKIFAIRFLTDMTNNHFRNRPFNDRDIEDYTQSFLDNDEIHINYASNNIANLLKYCGWSLDDAMKYLNHVGHKGIKITFKQDSDDELYEGIILDKEIPNCSHNDKCKCNIYTVTGVWCHWLNKTNYIKIISKC